MFGLKVRVLYFILKESFTLNRKEGGGGTNVFQYLVSNVWDKKKNFS